MTNKKLVQEFWNSTPCGTRNLTSEEGSKEYFYELEATRYKLEPFIVNFANFSKHRHKKVLEVGVGAGTDFLQFAREGADLFGTDLTYKGVSLVKQRLALENFHASIFQSDAENLPFSKNQFDFIYSWGVVHHTQETQRAIDEIIRVAKLDGEVCVMIYHRRSLVALQCWILNALLKCKPWLSFSEVIEKNIESIGTKAYTVGEAKKMFKKLNNLKITPVVTPYDVRLTRTRFLPKWIQSIIPNRLGWFLVIQGKKISE